VEQVRQRFASFAAAARLGKFFVSETELIFSMCKLVQVVWRIYKEISVLFACSGETFQNLIFISSM
jgi:hypothetical protein